MHCALFFKVVDDWPQRVPHSKQDTQMSIEFYHGVLKHWFSLGIKGFKGHRIDWLVWKLKTTIA